jgi:hypothetical protein
MKLREDCQCSSVDCTLRICPAVVALTRSAGRAVRALVAHVHGMRTVTEIAVAIEKLPALEQREFAEWFNSRLLEDTLKMLSILAAGIRSLETEPEGPIGRRPPESRTGFG